MQGYRITICLLCVVKVFGCDVQQFQVGDSCYEFVQPERNLTWMKALTFCKDSGGSLVSFETPSEQDAVRNYRYDRYNANEKFYIGLYNQGIDPIWVSGVYPAPTRWSPASAPSVGSCEGTVLDVTDNNWLRVMCDIRYQEIGYICEYKYERPTTKSIPTITQIRSTAEGTRKTNDLTVLCPRDHFVYDNSCYEFVEDPNTYNWTYAVKTCLAKGGQLVSLETVEENDAIMKALKQNFNYKELYIGLKRSRNSVNTTWLSGAPLKYDRHGENDSNFRCSTIFSFQSLWFSRPCDPGVSAQVVKGYICEYLRETLPSADATVSMSTPGRTDSTANVTSVLRTDGADSTLKIGVLISVLVVLLILIIVAIIFMWRRRKIGKHPINQSRERTNKAFTDDVNEGLTQQGVEPPVYTQLATPDIIRQTPNPVGSIRLEINIQPSYESVDNGGSYYEIRQLNSKETDPIAKERFISRNISRAKTVFRMSGGKKRFADQGKRDIKNNRPQSCKPNYIAGQERAFYAQSNLGFSHKTCTLPIQDRATCSVANEHFYNKPIYDECGPSRDGEQIYSLPCTDRPTLNTSNTAETAEFDDTDHYYSSMTDPTIVQSDQTATTTSSDAAVYFVLEKPERDYGKVDNSDVYGKEVENEIYEGCP